MLFIFSTSSLSFCPITFVFSMFIFPAFSGLFTIIFILSTFSGYSTTIFSLVFTSSPVAICLAISSASSIVSIFPFSSTSVFLSIVAITSSVSAFLISIFPASPNISSISSLLISVLLAFTFFKFIWLLSSSTSSFVAKSFAVISIPTSSVISLSIPSCIFPLYISFSLFVTSSLTILSFSSCIISCVYPPVIVVFLSSYSFISEFTFISCLSISPSVSYLYVSIIFLFPSFFHVTTLFSASFFISIITFPSSALYSQLLSSSFFPFITNSSIVSTCTSSGFFSSILGVSISILSSSTGYLFPSIPVSTSIWIILLFSPFSVITLFVIISCFNMFPVFSSLYGLTNSSFTFLVPSISISFSLLSLYIPFKLISLSMFNRLKSNASSLISSIPTNMSLVSPAFIWDNVISFPSIFVIPSLKISGFNLKFAVPKLIVPSKYPSCFTVTCICNFKLFSSVVTSKSVPSVPSSFWITAENSTFLLLVLTSPLLSAAYVIALWNNNAKFPNSIASIIKILVTIFNIFPFMVLPPKIW